MRLPLRCGARSGSASRSLRRFVASLGLVAGVLPIAETRAAGDAASGGHELNVEVRGVLADVALRRRFLVGAHARDAAGREAVLPLALPPGARVVDVGLSVGGRVVPVERADEVELEGGVSGLRVQRAYPEEWAELRLRYRAPLACEDGRWVLRFPGGDGADLSGPRVQVRVGPGGHGRIEGGAIAGQPVLRRVGSAVVGTAVAPALTAWALVLGPEAKGGSLAVVATEERGRAPRAGRTWLGLCRPRDVPARGFPERLVVLVDGSRSNGVAGMALLRQSAVAWARGVTPLRWLDVARFAREPVWLFPAERAITGAALSEVEEALSPGHASNGSRLLPALESLARRLEQAGGGESDGEEFSGPPWLLLLTDGALGAGVLAPVGGAVPGGAAPSFRAAVARHADALASKLGGVAVLVVRPPGEEPARSDEVSALAELPRRVGGELRQLTAAPGPGEALELADDLRRGGALFEPRLHGPGSREVVDLVARLSPGQGIVRELPAGWPLGGAVLRGWQSGRPIEVRVGRARIASLPPPAPSTPGTPPGGAPAPRVGQPVRATLLGLASAAAPPRPDEESERGSLDREVLRHALGLRFLPRARACYLSRPAPDRAAARLQGRMRLALELERGEVLDVRVLASDLGAPPRPGPSGNAQMAASAADPASGVEDCVVAAAWALDVPRPARRDHPVTAIVNLVFRPARADGAEGGLSPELDEELELILTRPAGRPGEPPELPLESRP